MLLTGLGAALMFRAGMFNIGVEGAFFWAPSSPRPRSSRCPSAAGSPFRSPFVGALGGSLVCAIPGALKVRFDASELVTSLMFNFIALYVGLFLLNYFFRDPTAGALATARLPADVKLPRLIEGRASIWGSSSPSPSASSPASCSSPRGPASARVWSAPIRALPRIWD